MCRLRQAGKHLILLVVELQPLYMPREVVKVGQLHVVAELCGEHPMVVAGDRELQTLEIVSSQGEDVALVVNDMERYAVVVGQSFPARHLADEPQYGEGQMLVHPGDGTDFPHGPVSVVAGAEDLEAMCL